MNLSKETQNQINNWKKLKENDGFKLLTKALDEIIENAEKIIFSIGADREPEFTKRDVAIIKRDNAMELKELPENMIAQLSGTGTQPHENPDPYSNEKEEEDLEPEIEEEFEEDYNN